MSTQRETVSLVAGAPASQPDVLASDADRDTVAGMLSSAFAEGRLTGGEHADRARAAYAARTLGELAGLTADLPGPAATSRRQGARASDQLDRCLMCALLICCPPAGIAWLLVARRRALGSGGADATDR